jgi:hypothetical protein
MPSSGMLRRVGLVRIDVSEERSAVMIRAIRIAEAQILHSPEIGCMKTSEILIKKAMRKVYSYGRQKAIISAKSSQS